MKCKKCKWYGLYKGNLHRNDEDKKRMECMNPKVTDMINCCCECVAFYPEGEFGCIYYEKRADGTTENKDT